MVPPKHIQEWILNTEPGVSLSTTGYDPKSTSNQIILEECLIIPFSHIVLVSKFRCQNARNIQSKHTLIWDIKKKKTYIPTKFIYVGAGTTVQQIGPCTWPAQVGSPASHRALWAPPEIIPSAEFGINSRHSWYDPKKQTSNFFFFVEIT